MFRLVSSKTVRAEQVAAKIIGGVMEAQANEIKSLREIIESQTATIDNVNKTLALKNAILESNGVKMQEAVDLIAKLAKEKTAMGGVITNLRKNAPAAGKTMYNPNDQKAPSIYILYAGSDYVVYRANKGGIPRVSTAKEFADDYGHYERLKMIDNRKRLR